MAKFWIETEQMHQVAEEEMPLEEQEPVAAAPEAASPKRKFEDIDPEEARSAYFSKSRKREESSQVVVISSPPVDLKRL